MAGFRGLVGSNLSQKNAVAYAATTLAATMMNSIFQFYYVKVYLDLYRVTPGWFTFAQTVFMVWNAVNDPLFGWLQDHSQAAWLSNRRLNILYGAPFFVISFLVPWFPFLVGSAPMWVLGLHLTFALCFYDTMFTFVLLAQCSLFAELSPHQDDRHLLVKYSQVASLIGSTSIFFCQYVSWNATVLTQLQVFTVVVAFVSYLSLRYSATHMVPAVRRADEGMDKDCSVSGTESKSPFSVIWQIVSNKNFIFFVGMNFCQVFHLTFRTNFFASFADYLIGIDLGASFLTYLAGMAYIIPQTIVLLSGPILAKFGSYKLIYVSFALKLLFASAMYSAGRENIALVAVFFIVDRSLAEATFAFFNLSLSEIIDEDCAKYKRRLPQSSMVFGMNALFTKPAQSIAPILTVNYLERFGYSSGGKTRLMTWTERDTVKDAIFHLLVIIPLVLSVIQMLLWSLYSHRSQNRKTTDVVAM